MFAEYNGGIHNGINDHSIAIGLAWEPWAVWCGIKVIDDTHENGGSGWDGDSVQMAFGPAERAGTMILYNYGLTDDGTNIVHHQRHPCPDTSNCTDAAMERLDDVGITIYEMVFPPHSLGVDVFFAGYQFAVGICVNDGDTDVENHRGQKGWSGWGAYSIVFGKNVAGLGVATLVAAPPAPPPSACPTGYQTFRGMCYFFSHVKASWYEAVDICDSYGGSLVTIDDEDEIMFIATHLTTRLAANDDYWCVMSAIHRAQLRNLFIVRFAARR